MIRFLLPLLVLLLFSLKHTASAASNGYLRDGDRWVCLGDSITALDCYPPLLQDTFQLYHPAASLTVINSGVAGDTASDSPEKLQQRVLKYNPTIVSVMYGMNEAINSWQPTQPREPVQARYRANLTYITRTLKAKGIEVLLMSPTPTDPSNHAFFTVDKTPEFLHQCAAIVREVAASEGAVYVPVQEEFEALAQQSPPGIALTADGVHPSALGQYRIARSLISRVGMALPLATGKRSLPAAGPSCPVQLELSTRFVPPDSASVPLSFNSAQPSSVTVTYSLRGKSSSEKLDLPAGATAWQFPLPAADPLNRDGQAARALISLRTPAGESLHILDLSRTAVLHLNGNAVGDKIQATLENGEEKLVGTWRAEKLDNDLLLNFQIATSKIQSEGVFPFQRDGLNLMLDFRPTARFADIGVDREVTQLFLSVREKPFFSVGVRAWTGWGLDFASTAAGERTPDGYKVQLLIHDNFNLHSPVQLSKRDFVGLLVGVNQHDLEPGKDKLTITTNQKNDLPVSLYANNLMILDLKNKLPGNSVINLALN